MELIERKDDLRELVEKSTGCVVYGAGMVGIDFIRYLKEEKLINKIICIAVKSKEGNPSSILGIPVVELKELESYRTRYVFLVATMQFHQKSIENELREFGSAKFVGLSDLFYTCIRTEVSAYESAFEYEIFSMLQKLNKDIERLSYIVEEQNEISCTNTNTFSRYRDYFSGKDVAIVATGPTLKKYIPLKDVVHIGVNTVYKESRIPLDFLFVQDGRPSYLREKYLGLENVKCPIFMGNVLKRSGYEFTQFPEEYRIGNNIKEYVFDHNWPNERIYKDICHHPISGGVTVSISALQFALFTNPRRIYLVGCDTTSSGHYDGTLDKECPISEMSASIIRARYIMAKEFAEIHYPKTEIISINPVGLKGIFKDVYTDMSDYS